MSESPSSSLEMASQAVNVATFLDYRAYLESVYQWIKSKRNGAYSYVAFSVDLTLGRSNMVHLVVRGKRHLRASGIRKISVALGLKGAARLYLENLHALALCTKTEARESLMRKLVELKSRILVSVIDKAKLAYYAAWYHPVVREFACFADFDGTPGWIARRVRPSLTEEQVQESLNLLENLGFLTRDSETGILKQSESTVFLEDGVESLDVVRYHQTVLELAKMALVNQSGDEREVRAFTMSLSNAQAVALRGAIADFQQKVMEIASEQQPAEAVFQLNLQLFPVSKE